MASIRERTSAGVITYQVLFRHGSKQKSRTFHDQTKAKRFMARIDLDGVDAALESLAPRPAGGITVDQLADLWFEAREADVKTGELTPRVLTGYRRDYANWISTWLGHLPADSVTELQVQNWVDKIKVMPRSQAKSVADRHSILHGIYRWGADPRRALVKRNPCVGTDLPKRTKKPPKGLRLPELQALTTTARRMYPDAADLIEFIAGTGWRLGESLALTAGQVEDDGTSVYVTMSRVWRREVGFTDGGKSGAAMRRLRVLGGAVPTLRRRLVGLGPADLVFTRPNPRAGKPGQPDVIPWDESTFRRDYWGKITTAAGLGGGWVCSGCEVVPTTRARAASHTRRTGHEVERIEGRNPTPHWLRHSHVFVCHAAGMSLAEIQRRIGHEDIKMTINTYGRLIDDMSDDVAARLDALLTPGALPVVVRGEVQSSSSTG